jgi:predicted GIY-YIG superfamily endonuclease
MIYKIPCECGANYIGETGCPLETRVKEHKRNWLKLSELQEKYINVENISSLLAALAAENKHHVKWGGSQDIGKGKTIIRRKKSMKQRLCT